MSGEKTKEAKGVKRIGRAFRVFKYVMPHKGKFLLGMMFLFLSTFTFMLFPGLVGRLLGENLNPDSPIDRFFGTENIDQVALVLLGAFVLQGVFSFFRVLIFADVTERAIAAVRQDTYNHLITLPMAYFSTHRVGELSSRISNDISQLQELFMSIMAELVRQCIIILFGTVLLFFYSVELTFVMLGSLPVMMLVAFFFGRFIRKLGRRTQDELARSQVVVEETLQGIQSVKSYAMEAFEIARYKKATDLVRRIAMKGAAWRGAFASFIIVGLFGAVVLVVWYGVRLKNAGEIGMDELMSFILYSMFVGGSVGGVADVFGRLQKAIGATENLFDIMGSPGEMMAKTAVKSDSLKGAVVFDNVGFSYPSRKDKQVLMGLSFTVKPGERVALVGASGAGKSSIAALLLRFYDVDTGSITVDGKAISTYALSHLRGSMALVPQEVLLFGGSIRENIAYGKPDATEQEIAEAARKANAFDFIQSFPEGFDTVVGERGIQLSGGQRQRIAIARAILKDPKILILDEATSALDAESERVVQEALDRLMQGRTSVVIAHRLSTIRKADKILVLEHGRILESGTHEDLMNIENGHYRTLSHLQIIG